MAIVGRIFLDAVDQSDHDRLETAVESRLQDLGGPPDGLMVHMSYPHDGGFLIVEAWRTEELFRSYVDNLLRPALAEAGLAAAEPEVGAAWSIARP